MRYWLRKRFGCSGKSRDVMFENFKKILNAEPQMQQCYLGLSDTLLCQLAKQFQFARIQHLCPSRGSEEILKRIAWYGSALSDINTEEGLEHSNRVLTEGALFNVAVALFDTIIDDMPAKKQRLMQSINLPCIEKRLHYPQNETFALKNEEDELIDLIAKLFDAVFRSIGTRLLGDKDKIDRLFSVIAAMYNSEIGKSHDPFKAKYLPIQFIGQLNGKYQSHEFYKQLANFIFLYDDWIDMPEDYLNFKPNFFLLKGYHYPIAKQVIHFLSGLKILLFPFYYHKKIRQTVLDSLMAVIAQSRKINFSAHQRCLYLCRQLLQA